MASSAGCVMVVDDEMDIWMLVGDALREEGYEVMAASNGAEAFVLLSDRLPAVILLDMRMPEMNGWEFARAVRERWGRRVPIVVMTADAQALAFANEIAADDFLPKPFDLDQLSRVVGRFTRARAAG